MWQAVTDAVGIAGRDALWDYPDLMPTAEDIDDPAGLVARLTAASRGETAPSDAMDDALAQLLAEETAASSGTGDDGDTAVDDDGDEPTPGDQRPV